MSKHTPGPWHTRIAVNGTGDFGIVTPDGDVLAEAFSDIRSQNERSQDVVYNARLIAAAPDLLEACKVAFEQTCSVGRPRDWEQLRAAIAKATGESA